MLRLAHWLAGHCTLNHRLQNTHIAGRSFTADKWFNKFTKSKTFCRLSLKALQQIWSQHSSILRSCTGSQLNPSVLYSKPLLLDNLDIVSDLSSLATFKRLVKTELYNRAYLRWLVTTRTYDSSLCEWLNVRHQPCNNNNNNLPLSYQLLHEYQMILHSDSSTACWSSWSVNHLVTVFRSAIKMPNVDDTCEFRHETGTNQNT